MNKVSARIPQGCHGATVVLDFAIEFLQWADGKVPAWQDIANRFQVSRATAYRYRKAFSNELEKYGSLKFERAHRTD